MRFTETGIPGVWMVEIEPHRDARGFFARSFCQREFAEHGLPTEFVQCNISYNEKRGTLRGMHFQKPPSPEGKLVSCLSGGILDVVLDLRPDSPTYCRWTAAELSRDNHTALYIPPGLAHGFQTLEDGSDVFYMMTEFYQPGLAGGVRWDDPAFGITWPLLPPGISDRDAAFPDFQP